MIEHTELAYLAGFFDGEGSICVQRRGSGQHVLTVSVGQIDPRPLQAFKRRYGGTIRKQRRSETTNHRDFHLWAIGAKSAGHLLVDLLPYLVVKRAQAVLGIALQKRMRHQGGNKGLPPGEREAREDLRQRISLLNKMPYSDGDASLAWAELTASGWWRELEEEMRSGEAAIPLTIVDGGV